jgi:hypothetical protein
MHYINTGHSLLAKNMQALYRAGNTQPAQEVHYDEGSDGLSKAEELGLLDTDATDIEKGRKAMPIGSHATWGGVQYLKTASGWKVVGKVRGHVKENHDLIHNNEDKDKDHHAMVHDAGNMSAEEWTKKHASNLHSKYKEVHDYLHKEKVKKEDTDKVIGKTQTGKDIHNNFNHPSHKDFTSEEHATAAGAHKYQLDVLNRFNDDHTGKVDTMMHHNNQAKLHEEASKTQKPEENKEGGDIPMSEMSIGTKFKHGGHPQVYELTHKLGENGYNGSTYPFRAKDVETGVERLFNTNQAFTVVNDKPKPEEKKEPGTHTSEDKRTFKQQQADIDKQKKRQESLSDADIDKQRDEYIAQHGSDADKAALAKKKDNGFSTSTSGIEVGKVYQHENYGKVKVTKVEKNTGDKSDSISHHITFKTRGGEGIEETQGINGFRHGTTGDYNGTPKAAEEKPKEEIKTDRYTAPQDHDWSFLKTLPEKQLEKQKDLAHKQIVNIGQQHGMKESDVAKYPKQIKQALDELTYKVERIDQEIADRRNGELGGGSDGKHGLSNEPESAFTKEHLAIKKKYTDAVLLHRAGDYYETIGDDAKKLSDATGIRLTTNKNGTHLAGFPHYDLEKHLTKTVKAGHRVALHEQDINGDNKTVKRKIKD